MQQDRRRISGWIEDPVGELVQLGERAFGRLEHMAMDDCWTVRPHTARVMRVRTSPYVEDELLLAGPDGTAQSSGLSGSEIGARAGHRITVIRLTARNSGRERPVALFDHDTGKAAILGGNLAPLLRSRFELTALLAGIGAALVAAAAGVGLLAVLAPLELGRAAMPLFGLAAALFPLGLVFVDNRRRRLKRRLEALCQDMVAQLRAGGGVAAGPVSVTPPAEDAPPPVP